MAKPVTPSLVTAAELARWLGISVQALRKHAEAGKITKTGDRYDLRQSILDYCAALRETAAGRGGPAAVGDLTEERARLAKAQADAQEMKNALLKGKLIPADQAEREWGDVMRSLRARILAIPSRLRMAMGHLQPSDITQIDRELRDALTSLGNGEALEPIQDEIDDDAEDDPNG